MFNPNFTITNNLLTYISKIEAAKTIIEMSPLVPSWEAKFRDDAMTRTIHYGTKIEGNDLTEEQASQVIRLTENDSEAVIKKTGIVARDRDIQEVINYRNVISWMNTLDKRTYESIFNTQTLKEIHAITTKHLIDEGDVGTFRNKQVIVKSAVGDGVVFRPPISVEIPFLIDDFFFWAKSPSVNSIHPIVRAAITHYQLVFIHPFVEGNGRTARAMATLVLYTLGYDFKKFFSIEQYFDSDVETYYQALLSVQQSSQADMTYWLEYFCYGLAIEIDKVQRQVLKLSKDLKLKKQLGKQVALSERQIILLELFQNQEVLTSEDAQSVLPHISVDTILRDIKDLIEKGVIKKQGVTKGVRYRLVE